MLMRSKPRIRYAARATRASAVGLLVAVLLAGAAWSRPSLIDNAAQLQQIISGLCHGDAALCGLPAPLVFAGQVNFGVYKGDFFELSFGYDKPVLGQLAFIPLTVTMNTALFESQLTDDLLNATVHNGVTVQVPDPTGPGQLTLLELDGVVVTSVDTTGGSNAIVSLTFTKATMDWLGEDAVWDAGMMTGGGCFVPSSEQHVALRGNDASLLAGGEIEADFSLGVAAPSSLSFALERKIGLTSPCYLQHTGFGINLLVDVHRLSPLSDTFATQLREQSLQVTTSTVTAYRLQISGTDLDEVITVDIGAASLTTRTFNAGTGAETSSDTISLP